MGSFGLFLVRSRGRFWLGPTNILSSRPQNVASWGKNVCYLCLVFNLFQFLVFMVQMVTIIDPHIKRESGYHIHEVRCAKGI